MVQFWVAASSAAWGWQNSQSGPTIPKSFGFEAATPYETTNNVTRNFTYLNHADFSRLRASLTNQFGAVQRGGWLNPVAGACGRGMWPGRSFWVDPGRRVVAVSGGIRYYCGYEVSILLK